MTAIADQFAKRPWALSFAGALLVWLASIAFTGGYGAGGMITSALALATFMVIAGVGQMFVITLGPGNVDLSLASCSVSRNRSFTNWCRLSPKR